MQRFFVPTLSILSICIFLAASAMQVFGQDYSSLKIAPPPEGGLYLGQYEWQNGDIATFEAAIGKKVPLWSSRVPMDQYNDAGHPIFDPDAAERAWQEGKAILAHAYEAYPNPGDGADDIAAFQPSTNQWFIDTDRDGMTDLNVPFGIAGDEPMVSCDFNGDGVDDIAVFRPSTGQWLIDTNRDGMTDLNVPFGIAGDEPMVSCDFNGDGVDDIAVFRPSTKLRSPHVPIDQYNDAGYPIFDPDAAERAWQEGRVISAYAYEAYPNPGDGADDIAVLRSSTKLRSPHVPIDQSITSEVRQANSGETQATIGTAATPAGAAGMRVYIDPKTGEFVEPPDNDYSSLKIAPPPGGGMYLGQHEWSGNDVETFEAAIGRKVAFLGDEGISGFDGGGSFYPNFDSQAAERAWQEGKFIFAGFPLAGPFVPETGQPTGFTYDKLLNGEYDKDLKRLAGQYRQFGKPMLFETTREPNGLGFPFLGGFGPLGDKDLTWALKNGKGLAEFDPSKFPNAGRYSDLGDPNVCDGVERLIAAQRYYHDFFVRQEGLNFLTFDTMGWAVGGDRAVELSTDEELTEIVVNEFGVNPGSFSVARVRKLFRSCVNFEHFYPGDKYVDWVSITWYMAHEFGATIQDYLDGLAYTMAQIKEVAPNKPVFIVEMGFNDINQDATISAEKITVGLNELITKYPEVHGIAMWSKSGEGPGVNFLIRPNTQQGNAFKSVVDANPSYFHSCVYFSDGSMIPTCP